VCDLAGELQFGCDGRESDDAASGTSPSSLISASPADRIFSLVNAVFEFDDGDRYSERGMGSANAERYRRVASGFTQRVSAIHGDSWLLPAPCEGWVALDVVRHLVEWVPPFLADGTGLTLAPGPSVDEDPVAAWLSMSDGIQSLLDDPDKAESSFDHPMVGHHRVDEAVMSFILTDVLIHTWDLARAAGLDETLDAAEIANMFDGIHDVDALLRESGHYGPKIEVAADADVQTQLIAFLGRQP